MCINKVCAQPDNGTNISSNDAEWDDGYILLYKVDGQIYKLFTLEAGAPISLETEPTKEGYTFSGWSEKPQVMPANNVEITGSFTVNQYLLTVLVEGEIFYSDSIAFGTRLTDYMELIIQKGLDLSQWDLYSEIDKITMPAHDVTITAVPNAVHPIIMDTNEAIIYDLTGRRIETEDISALPAGIYIRNGRKYVVQ